MDTEFHFDVVVVGAGHAGCEAAAAAARTGAKTCLITIDMNKIAQMSCNPAIGGIAKGQIVREIDALGGQTGEVTDATAIQFRMLNRSKGPAMWSPRAQCDRTRFIKEWRHRLENTENLSIWQDEVTEIIVEKDKRSPDFMGSYFPRPCCGYHGRNISKWSHARRTKASTRRTVCRTCSNTFNRINRQLRHTLCTNENGNTSTH